MKQKINVQLPEELFAELEAATEQKGTTRTAIVEAALRQFLSDGAETDNEVALRRRLEWMSRQLEQLERELRIVNETVALHARFHLTITPRMPQTHQRAACLLGQERFEVFAAQVGRRVHLGTPLMREAMDRLTTENPDLFEGIEFGLRVAFFFRPDRTSRLLSCAPLVASMILADSARTFAKERPDKNK